MLSTGWANKKLVNFNFIISTFNAKYKYFDVIIDLNQMYEEDGEKSEDTLIHLGKILKFN